MDISIDRQELLAPVALDADAGGGLADPEVAARYVGLTLDASPGPGGQVPKAGSQPATARSAMLDGGQALALQDGKAVGIPDEPIVVGLPAQTQPGQPVGLSLGDKGPQPQGIPPTPPNSAVGVSPVTNLEDRGFNNAGAGQGPGEAGGRSIGLPLVGASGDQVGRSPAMIGWRPNDGGSGLEFSLTPQPGQALVNGFREVVTGSVEFPALAPGPSAFADPRARLDLKIPPGDPGGSKPHEVRLVGRAESVAIGGRQSIASDDKATPDAVLIPLAGALPTRHEQELVAIRSLEGQMVAEMLILVRLRRRPYRDLLLDGDYDLAGTAQTAQISLRNLYPSWDYPIEFNMRVARYIKSRRRDKRRAKKDEQDERQDQQP